ncbi:MAG: hypothetical protein RIE73_18160 [Coleofasciculus sp. C1-SOL-03]|uniref:hypothetical protein n=1 Tax=Coleofasciculus sp. C1-SOL-03 TaxID=3069522 RepID=UPI003302622F
MSNTHPSNRHFIMARSWIKENFVNLLVLAFFCISFIGILNHEMWRDELQAWMIARDSSSLINLFENLRYEGHPGLWHLGLYVITRFTSNPFWMQIYHLIIATATVYVFARFSPFTRLTKILFSFGYFPFYEYSLISRNYALGVLLIFIFCTLFRKPDRNYIIFSIILTLLANTNIYGTMIAIAIGATLVFEVILEGNINRILADKKNQRIIGIVIFFIGVGGAIIQMLPPPDRWHGADWKLDLDIERLTQTISTIPKGYLLMVWNYIPMSDNFLFNLFIFSVLIGISLILINQRKALFLYVSGTSLILLFSYTKFIGYWRHYGILFILLIACLWLSYNSNSENYNNYNNSKSQKIFIKRFIDLFKRNKVPLIILLMFIHLAVGIRFFVRDLIYPFSASKAVATYIQEKKLDNLIIVGYPSSRVSPIAGYLDKKVYYPQQNSFGSFVVWKKDNMKEMTTQEILEHTYKINQNNPNQSLLLITNYSLEENDEITFVKPNISISKKSEFTRSLFEKYYLYIVKR